MQIERLLVSPTQLFIVPLLATVLKETIDCFNDCKDAKSPIAGRRLPFLDVNYGRTGSTDLLFSYFTSYFNASVRVAVTARRIV